MSALPLAAAAAAAGACPALQRPMKYRAPMSTTRVGTTMAAARLAGEMPEYGAAAVASTATLLRLQVTPQQEQKGSVFTVERVQVTEAAVACCRAFSRRADIEELLRSATVAAAAAESAGLKTTVKVKERGVL